MYPRPSVFVLIGQALIDQILHRLQFEGTSATRSPSI